tara:strand:+ start:37743 stop:38360 length:618 start_codon:yes stop_codon:yes gene_type:complete
MQGNGGMGEKMYESLSAILDGEANELELQRVLGAIGDDEALRRTWVRYAAVRGVLKNQQQAGVERDISQRIRAMIAESPAHVDSRDGRRRWRPLASFAVAASVAMVVVIGGQQLAHLNGGKAASESATLAARPSPVGMLNSLGSTPVQASYGTQPLPVLQPATRTAYEQLARQRMSRYMQEHAEHAALNSPHGLIPFARVPEIRE